MKHKGTLRFILAALAASVATLAWNHGGIIPEDWKEIVSVVLVALLISFFWFLIRGIQKNEVNLLTILGAVALTALVASPFIGWVINIISGNPSWSVNLGDIVKQYALTLIFAVIAKMFLTPGLLSQVGFGIFDEDE